MRGERGVNRPRFSLHRPTTHSVPINQAYYCNSSIYLTRRRFLARILPLALAVKSPDAASGFTNGAPSRPIIPRLRQLSGLSFIHFPADDSESQHVFAAKSLCRQYIRTYDRPNIDSRPLPKVRAHVPICSWKHPDGDSGPIPHSVLALVRCFES